MSFRSKFNLYLPGDTERIRTSLGGNSPWNMWLRFKRLKVYGIVVFGFNLKDRPRSRERDKRYVDGFEWRRGNEDYAGLISLLRVPGCKDESRRPRRVDFQAGTWNLGAVRPEDDLWSVSSEMTGRPKRHHCEFVPFTALIKRTYIYLLWTKAASRPYSNSNVLENHHHLHVRVRSGVFGGLYSLWLYVRHKFTWIFEQSVVRRALPVLAVERIYHTLVPQSPFLIDRTTTITWTWVYLPWKLLTTYRFVVRVRALSTLRHHLPRPPLRVFDV